MKNKSESDFPYMSVKMNKRMDKACKKYYKLDKEFKKVTPKKYMENTSGKSGLVRGLTIDEQ